MYNKIDYKGRYTQRWYNNHYAILLTMILLIFFYNLPWSFLQKVMHIFLIKINLPKGTLLCTVYVNATAVGHVESHM